MTQTFPLDSWHIRETGDQSPVLTRGLVALTHSAGFAFVGQGYPINKMMARNPMMFFDPMQNIISFSLPHPVHAPLSTALPKTCLSFFKFLTSRVIPFLRLFPAAFFPGCFHAVFSFFQCPKHGPRSILQSRTIKVVDSFSERTMEIALLYWVFP